MKKKNTDARDCQVLKQHELPHINIKTRGIETIYIGSFGNEILFSS